MHLSEYPNASSASTRIYGVVSLLDQSSLSHGAEIPPPQWKDSLYSLALGHGSLRLSWQCLLSNQTQDMYCINCEYLRDIYHDTVSMILPFSIFVRVDDRKREIKTWRVMNGDRDPCIDMFDGILASNLEDIEMER